MVTMTTQSKRDYVLSNHALSQDYRQRFEATVGAAPTYLTLAKLRQHGAADALRTLRGLRADRFFLPVEDANGQAVLPILQMTAALSDARAIEIVHPDMRREMHPRWRTGAALAATLWASAAGRLALGRCRRELENLAHAPRTDMEARKGNRVLYVNANLWFGVQAGGSVGHTTGVVNALVESGHDVTLAALAGLPQVSSAVRFTPLEPPTAFGLPPEINHYPFHESVTRQLAAVCQEHVPSFLYQRMSVANYTGVVLSRRFGIPLILEYNGSEVWVAKHWGRPLRYHRAAALAEDACLEHAHVVVTVSDVLRYELIERGVEPRRVVSYPNCIDPKIFDPDRFGAEERLAVRRRHGVADDAVMTTFVGTFGQWHGVDVLAQAIRELVRNHAAWLRRNRVHFVLVGDGLKMPIVQKTLSEPACQEFYTLTGIVRQDRTPAYLAASDILLSPHVANPDGSRFFGSPTKLFEYMAMGKAIAASDLDQIGEVLSDSLHVDRLPEQPPAAGATSLAVLCPPGDVIALCKAIMFLAENPAWRGRLGQNTLGEALEKYTWGRHVGAILERFGEIVAPATKAVRLTDASVMMG